MHLVLNLLIPRYLQENQSEMPYMHRIAYHQYTAQIPFTGPVHSPLSCSDGCLLTAHTYTLILKISLT